MQLTPEQVKGRIKNIAKVNNADARMQNGVRNTGRENQR